MTAGRRRPLRRPDRMRRPGPWSRHRLPGLLGAWLLGLTIVAARAQDEVPFITTPDQVTLAMLQLAGVGPADHVIDLGSGDGRIVITAARRFGARGLGVEIVPDLVRKSRDNARAAGVADKVEFREQDLFVTDLAPASVITMYLLPDVNLQLRPRLLLLAPGTRIVSHDWDLGDWTPERTLTVEVPDKAVGREKLSRVHLWIVPAPVHGLWCAGRTRLEVTQRFAQFSATLDEGHSAPLIVLDGRIEGRVLHGTGTHAAALLQWSERGLRLERIGAPAQAHAGRMFARAGSGGCTGV
jgi:SAM-dependent methyltransferase